MNACVFDSAGPADTQALAVRLAGLCEAGDLVLLSGELGAGKTAFSQGFGAGLGVTSRITSPTFILVQTYEGRIPMHHVDAYRLVDIEEAEDLGLAELLDGPGVTVIEWAERIRSVLPADCLEIEISQGDDANARRLEMQPVGRRWAERAPQLAELVEEVTAEVDRTSGSPVGAPGLESVPGDPPNDGPDAPNDVSDKGREG